MNQYDKNGVWLDPKREHSELRIVHSVYASGDDFLLEYVIFRGKKAVGTELAKELHGKTAHKLITKICTALNKPVVESPDDGEDD